MRSRDVDSEGARAPPLSRSLLLSLPVGEGPLEAASALILDEAHIAVVGVPHPSAGTGKGLYCSFMLLHAITSVVAGTPLRYHFSLCLVFTPVINNNDNKRIQVVQYVSSKIPAAAPNCTVT